MRNLTRRFLCAALLFLSYPAAAQQNAEATVVELFTSQSCSSCPPADILLAELSERPDIIALEFHVDYQDRALTFSGSWKDPFSKPEWTLRQKNYGQLYTPQMIIDGNYQVIGSHRDEVESFIKKAQEDRARDNNKIGIVQEKNSDGTFSLTLNGSVQNKTLDILFARFVRETETDVHSGENKGKNLRNRNIVQTLAPIGVWYGGLQTFHYSAAALSQSEGCAVLLQDRVDKHIAAAQKCPE